MMATGFCQCHRRIIPVTALLVIRFNMEILLWVGRESDYSEADQSHSDTAGKSQTMVIEEGMKAYD